MALAASFRRGVARILAVESRGRGRRGARVTGGVGRRDGRAAGRPGCEVAEGGRSRGIRTNADRPVCVVAEGGAAVQWCGARSSAGSVAAPAAGDRTGGPRGRANVALVRVKSGGGGGRGRPWRLTESGAAGWSAGAVAEVATAGAVGRRGSCGRGG